MGLILFLIFYCSTHVGSDVILNTSCAYFDFPSLPSNTLSAKVNTTVRFPFKLINTGCNLSDFFRLKVAKVSSFNKIQYNKIQCVLPHINGSCRPPLRESSCSCGEEVGIYQFIHTAEKSDNTTWVWFTDSGEVQEKELDFNVIYPPEIKDLTVAGFESGSLLLQNATAEVSCTWQNGNPPHTAWLIDRHGKVLASSTNDQNVLIYSFVVGCQDAGLIRCEAPGASHNKTATLLVKCSPQFVPAQGASFIVPSGHHATLTFNFRAHTKLVLLCQLKLASAHTPHDVKDCSSFITGTPPDLTLTVRLDHVRKQNEGQWTLTLTNDAGVGHVDFSLHVTEVSGHTTHAGSSRSVDVAESSLPTSNINTHTPGPGDVSRLTVISVNIAGVLIIVIVIVVVGVICMKKVRGAQVPPLPTPSEACRFRPQLRERAAEGRQPREVISMASNLYDEVKDEASETGSVGQLEQCTNSDSHGNQMHNPDIVPDDYLHPVPSTSQQ